MTTKPKRQVSEHAQVAKLCRQHCKRLDIKCRAKSVYDLVEVTVNDQTPDMIARIESDLSQYKRGHFNGMEDIYEYSNRNVDIPQVNYLRVVNDISDELRDKCWHWMRANLQGADIFPADYRDVPHTSVVLGDYVQTLVYQIVRGSKNGLSEQFWAMPQS